MMDMLKREGRLLWSAVKKTRIDRIPAKVILLEFLANGIAGLVASAVYGLLLLFFKVETPLDSIGRMFGIKSKRILIDKETFEWTSWLLIVIVSLLVFTYVERVLECYLKERSRQKSEASDDAPELEKSEKEVTQVQ